MAEIPKGIASLLGGLLGSSKKGDLITLHTNLRILIQKLPSEIKSGGQKVTLATIQTLLQLIGNLLTSVSRGKTTGVVDILQDIQIIVQILQDSVTNPGARAVFANIYIELSILLNNIQVSGRLNVSQITATLKSLTISLTATLKGLQSGSQTGGLSGSRDLLQNIFFTFSLLQEQLSNGQSSAVNSLLQQLSFLLDGLELTSSGSSSANILHSISINLDLMLHSTSVSFTNDDILRFIKATANSLNLTFDLSGITGIGNFVGGSTGSSAQYLQQISLVLNNLQTSISSNNLKSVQTLIFQLGNLKRNLNQMK